MRTKQDDLQPQDGESEEDFLYRCIDELGDEDACQVI